MIMFGIYLSIWKETAVACLKALHSSELPVTRYVSNKSLEHYHQIKLLLRHTELTINYVLMTSTHLKFITVHVLL